LQFALTLQAQDFETLKRKAEQGDAVAQYNLGVMYADGEGVAQNDAEAVQWFRKAAEQGLAGAQFNLGQMYRLGRGVVQSDAEAVQWYRKAAEQGHGDAQKVLAALKNQTTPAAQGSSGAVELFGARLKNATRTQLRTAFGNSPLQAKREQDEYWVDLYNSGAALEGSSQLAVGYTHAEGQFAYAEYTFPSHMDTQQVQRVVEMVAAKYGKPGKFSGSVGLGNVEAVWQRGKDVTIKVYRGWPDTTTYLRFSDRDAEGRMNAEMKANDAAQTRQKAKAQSGAF